MNEPKFRLHGARRGTLKAEWETVKQRVAAQNANPQRFVVTPLPAKPTELQKQWHQTQMNVARALGLIGNPASKGSIYGDEKEQESEE